VTTRNNEALQNGILGKQRKLRDGSELLRICREQTRTVLGKEGAKAAQKKRARSK